MLKYSRSVLRNNTNVNKYLKNMKTITIKNFTCKLGETAKENWTLIDLAENEHIFFHLSSFPSGYVILEYEGELTPVMLQIAAQICRESTKYRNILNLKVDYCRCDNLTKGEKVGEVYFKSNRKVKQVNV